MSIQKFRTAVSILRGHPPVWKTNTVRDRAFSDIDTFLEAYIRPGSPYDLKRRPNDVWTVVESNLARAISEIEEAQRHTPPRGVDIWQMYNSGVIIQMDGIVIGLDVIPILRDFDWIEPPGFTRKIAGLIDLLLVTHRHRDHFDQALVRTCLAAGKPVCMPKALADTLDQHAMLIPIDGTRKMKIGELAVTGRTACHVWKNTVDELPVVYYEVTGRSGFSFIFSGDADYTKVFEKTADKDIDLLFLPWRNPNKLYEDGSKYQQGTTLDAVNLAIKKIKPKGLIYEHYGELKHVYEGFHPSYGLAQMLKENVKIPSERMFWGEHIRLQET